MKECFHFTKSKHLRSILENGLQPQFGANCSIIGDRIGEKVSYSVGSEEATRMFKGVYEKYCRISEGYVNIESFDENSRKAIQELQEAKDFEDWEGPGVYLMFNGECIDEEHRDETKPYDSYTDMPIPPEQLSVCVIRNRETGEIITSKYDVVSFWLARDKNKKISFYNMEYEDRIEEFKSDKYEMEYVEIARFCEMHPEILGEEISSSELLPQVIEDKKRRFGLTNVIQFINKIKTKIKTALTKGETAESSKEAAPTINEPSTDETFRNKLRDESKTIEEAATEIIESAEKEVKNKSVEPQTPEEI